MAGWLIYIPGRTHLREIPQLEGVVRADDSPLRSVPTDAGPDGKGGQLWFVADESRTPSWPHMEFNRETQSWKAGPGGSFWLGLQKGAEPTPDDLRRRPREDAGENFEVRLADGRIWLVPNGMTLPMAFAYDSAGGLTLQPKSEHAPVYDRCLQALQVAQESCVLPEPIHSGNLQFAVDHCGAMLSLNYRINVTLAVMLGLFSPKTLWQCLCLTTDVDAINRLIDDLEKKSLSATGDSPASSSGSTG